jgi:hypothetical protein
VSGNTIQLVELPRINRAARKKATFLPRYTDANGS